jgi:serine/threonine-protein kinase
MENHVSIDRAAETEVGVPKWTPHQVFRKSLSDIMPLDPMVGCVEPGHFEILALIGTGACSRVYKARQLDSQRIIAVKILHEHLLSDAESVARFQREAESGASIDHRNVCKLYDYGHLSTGLPFIAMEYMDGESLSSILRRKQRLPALDALPIFIDCCDGLTAAHQLGIIHRDIKPANIFIIGSGKDRVVKLLDFGLAKLLTERNPSLTQAGTALGTVQYMSPEQVMSHPVDARSDVYSLACVMFEALTGVKPFVGKSAFEVMEKHVRQLPQSFREVNPANDVRSDVEKVIFKALAKDPARRFARAEDLKSRLQALCVLLEERQTVGGGSCVAALAVALVVAVCVLFGWMQVSKFSNTSAATSSSVVR